MAYTNIDDPSAHFQTALYTGTSSNQSITNDGNSDMQPDCIAFKTRSNEANWLNIDSSRGVDSLLAWNQNQGEFVEANNDLESFDSNGFTVGVGSSGRINTSGRTYVAWQWKANGGTTSSNTDGSITSTVQANQDAGFSIVTYTGTGSAATIGHGLGVTPDIIIFKRRNGTNNWDFQYKGELRLTLNLTDAQATNVLCTFTSTTTDLGSVATGEKNANGGTYVAYCFAEKQGYSKFGTYRGNSSTDGAFVYLGFKPRWLMIKSTQAGMSWDIIDSTISTSNVMDDYLTANTSDPQGTSVTKNVDFLSNGFKWRYGNNTNFSDHTYVYMAFAENPFVTSTGIPTTAR